MLPIIEILKIFITAIENIDMGCSVCIERFIEQINSDLEKKDMPYKFVYEDYQVRVEEI